MQGTELAAVGDRYEDLIAVLKFNRGEISRNLYNNFSLPKNPSVLNDRFYVIFYRGYFEKIASNFTLFWRILFFFFKQRWESMCIGLLVF